MNTSLHDTQKIKAELVAELRKMESKLRETSGAEKTIEIMSCIRWLRNKINFYNSNHYPEYKRQNGQMQ